MGSFVDCWGKHASGLSALDRASVEARIQEHVRAGHNPIDAAKLAVQSHLDEAHAQLQSIYDQTIPKPPSAESTTGSGIQKEGGGAEPLTPVEDLKYTKEAKGTTTPHGEPEVRGISQARTEAELGAGSVEPGVGAELGSGIAFGRKYINSGGDPRLPIRRANTTGLVGRKEVGIVHAELERLRSDRNAAAEALEANPNNPTLQENFAKSDNAQREWRKELQPVLTKASDALREANAQSMPNADVGTYQGLADLMDEHFNGKREVTPKMRTEMAKAAKGVRETRKIANDEMRNIENTLEKQVKSKGRKVMSPEELDADLRGELETIFRDCILNA